MIYDTVSFTRKQTLVKYIEDWESIAFDFYTSKRDKYGEVDQEVSIAKGEWKVWNKLMLLMKDGLAVFRKGGELKCAIV